MSRYQGERLGDVIELHYFDHDGPIFVYMPKEGLEQMCGRSLDEAEISLILLSCAEKELFQLIDTAVGRCGGFTDALFENGAAFRKLHITTPDIEGSGLKISTNVLTMAARSGFADAHTGHVALRRSGWGASNQSPSTAQPSPASGSNPPESVT